MRPELYPEKLVMQVPRGFNQALDTMAAKQPLPTSRSELTRHCQTGR
jgi:hypothetical protein